MQQENQSNPNTQITLNSGQSHKLRTIFNTEKDVYTQLHDALEKYLFYLRHTDKDLQQASMEIVEMVDFYEAVAELETK